MFCRNCGSEIDDNAKFCAECGTSTDVTHSELARKNAPKSKKKIWLWVLGWIFIFPIPLTIILYRNRKMNPLLKYGGIALAWIFFSFAVSSAGNDATEPPIENTAYETLQQAEAGVSDVISDSIFTHVENEVTSIGNENESIIEEDSTDETTSLSFSNDKNDIDSSSTTLDAVTMVAAGLAADAITSDSSNSDIQPIEEVQTAEAIVSEVPDEIQDFTVEETAPTEVQIEEVIENTSFEDSITVLESEPSPAPEDPAPVDTTGFHSSEENVTPVVPVIIETQNADTPSLEDNVSTAEPEQEVSSSPEPAAPQTTIQEDNNIVYVWITKSGKKYHSKNNCGSTDTSKAYQKPLDEVKDKMEPCKNCWK